MKIFVTDGSAAGFLTAVFDAYRESGCRITSYEYVQMSFDSMIIRVEADEDKAKRVLAGMRRYDRNAPDDVMTALRSCDKQKEDVTFKYIKRLMESKKAVSRAFNFAEVNEFDELKRKVLNEVHKLSGFLRFSECSNGVLYAPYSPDNDITDLLMPHFARRLAAQRFVIHDIKRKIAGVYDGGRWIMVSADGAEIYLSERQKTIEALWKKYYDSVNVKERPHEKQMKGYMPVRYWKFLPEKKPPV